MSETTFADPSVFVRVRERSVAWRRVVDDIVLLDIAASRYHAVNPSGAAIWDRLAEGATIGELTATLAASYPQAEARAGADVARFLADLHERGMLEVSEPPRG